LGSQREKKASRPDGPAGTKIKVATEQADVLFAPFDVSPHYHMNAFI
jgi:hypothetical protein